MKIKHTPEQGCVWMSDDHKGSAVPSTIPHDCDIPDCPGAINKRKLEAFDGLLHACKYMLQFLDEYDVDRKLHPSLRQNLEGAIAKAEGPPSDPETSKG